eukprot:c32282_g1_i1.p1 GENE.c32282_g1_i1~~c32282_g1_i1.p1  ORF type:complete len:210 (-),score=46.62 c32282_g1_i1:93-722(-)
MELTMGLCQTLDVLISKAWFADDQPNPFACKKVPSVTLHSFAERLREHSHASKQAQVVACVYLCRIFQTSSSLFGPTSAHKLLVASLRVAAKWTDDEYLDNLDFAEIAGVPVVVLNQLEVEMVRLLRWDLTVASRDFANCQSWLTSGCELKFVIDEQSPPKPFAHARWETTNDDEWENNVSQQPEVVWDALNSDCVEWSASRCRAPNNV